jgi:hypothetical protein
VATGGVGTRRPDGRTPASKHKAKHRCSLELATAVAMAATVQAIVASCSKLPAAVAEVAANNRTEQGKVQCTPV